MHNDPVAGTTIRELFGTDVMNFGTEKGNKWMLGEEDKDRVARSKCRLVGLKGY